MISPFFDNLKNRALGFFIYSIVVNGFLEEGSKFLPTLFFKNKSRKDFVFLAGTLGISLACFENLMYFLRFSGEYFFLRILFTLPLHLSCSLLTALIFTNKEKFRPFPFLHGMIIHGFFNFFAFKFTAVKLFSENLLIFPISCAIIDLLLRKKVRIMKTSTTSERLKQLMRERNLRQVDILQMAIPYCRKYDISLSKSSLNQYISGYAIPGQHKLMILALALDVREAWLMGYDVPMEKKDEPVANENSPGEPQLTEGEELMLELFRRIPQDRQAAALELLRAALKMQ